MRLLTRFVGLLTLIAPIAIFLIWSVSYVYACFDQLLSPGKPLDVALQTPGGELRLKAERYSISLWQGALLADRVQLYEPDGKLLAGADRITATMASSDQGWDGPLKVKIRGLKGTLVRNADRSFPALRYLPEKTAERSKLPFSVEIDGADLAVADAADGGLLTGKYTIREALIEGVGESWLANLNLRRPGLSGDIQATIRQEPERALTATAYFDQADASSFAQKLRSLKEIKDEPWVRDVGVNTVVLNGKAEVVFPVEGEWKLQADLTSRSTGVRYGKDIAAQEVTFSGQVRQDGLNGEVKALVGKQPVAFDGQMSWAEGIQFAGRTSTRVSDINKLPAAFRKLVPIAASFQDASFEGWVAYDSKKGPRVQGELKAASMAWNKEVVRSPIAQIGYANHKFVADVKNAAILGGVGKGVLEYDEKSRQLGGQVEVDRVDLGAVGQKYLARKMAGRGQMSALLGGTVDKLEIDIRAHGEGSVALADNKLSPKANIEFAGVFNSAGLDIRRLKVYRGETAAMLTGRWDSKADELSIDGSIRRLELEDWIKDTTGTANVELTVGGKLSKPKMSGYAEIYAAKIFDYSLPFGSTDFTVSEDRVVASDLLLTRGASRLRGDVAYLFDGGKLEGKLSGQSIQLAEWAPAEISGLLDFNDAVVAGTLDKPRVEAKLLGESILIHGVLLDSGEANVVLNGKMVDLVSLTATGDAGTATGKGFFNLETQSGQLEASLDKLILAEVLPELPEKTQIDGTLRRVRVLAEVKDGAVSVAHARGTVSGLSINQTQLGQGDWSIRKNDENYVASARIGQIDAYIEAEEIKFNTSSKATSGEIYVKGYPLRDLYLLARPYMTVSTGQTAPPKFEAPAQLIQQLDRFQGSVNAGFKLSGTLDDLDVECPDLTLENMDLGGESAGELTSAFTRKDQVWDITKFNWKGGPGNLNITGKIDEHGDLDLDGEIKNFRPAWLKAALPDLPAVPGEATVSFIATGPTKNPTIHASLDGEILSERAVGAALVEAGAEKGAESKTTQAKLGLVLDTIQIQQGQITAEGRLNYGGLQGKIDAQVPFEYPFTIPEDKPIHAELVFSKRELAQLKELIPALDEKRTDGDVQASITVTGTKDDLSLEGGVTVNADKLAMTSRQTSLTGVQAVVRIKGDNVEVDAKGNSSRVSQNKANGTVSIHGLANLKRVLESLTGETDVMAIPLNGTVAFDNFAVNENLDEAVNGKSEQRLRGAATLDGRVEIRGTLGDLTVATTNPLLLTNVDGTFYSAFIGGKYVEPSPTAPKLAIDFVAGTAAKPANVKVANATFAMYGNGRIAGTTDEPNATASMTLASGTIRLPNARVAMDEGGTLRFLYRGGSAAQADTRLDVDLTGRTNISARGSTGLVERYDIRIGVSGNLLETEGQRIVATSDPGDLSQQKILALLGQSQIFETLDPSASRAEIQRQLQEALAGVALPAVFDSVTAQLARDIGLDYLNFEYNGYEGVTVAFARTLGKNLTLQGRRQLQPRPDEPVRFDLSLVYRPFQRKGSFRNISFTAGMDQDRPYKIGIEYTIRF